MHQKHTKTSRKSPLFWTKTDLRTDALFVYTIQQQPPKTTRLEAQETACFVTHVETQALFFPLWRDCRGVAPIEGTEMPVSSRIVKSPSSIAEALPRLRGLKYLLFECGFINERYCRGVAPIEGTEIPRPSACALTCANCRGVAPIEGTEI